MTDPVVKKIDNINADVAKIIELYNYAENLYPYENIRDTY